MQMGFYFDQSLCTGCYTCIIACKDWHDIVAGPPKLIRVSATENGKFPNVSVSYLATPCLHCGNPVCAGACPVNAITKRNEDGIVVVDEDACLGGEECRFACRKACPYDAPQFDSELNDKMQKCDLCLDRLTNHENPICVDACPMRALGAGPLQELEAKYGRIREAEGFVYSNRVNPSVVFKPKMK
jgi:anaerobic dimethyl sulfoxide reductase subunit B (iron-sulfur subunit)